MPEYSPLVDFTIILGGFCMFLTLLTLLSHRRDEREQKARIARYTQQRRKVHYDRH